MGRVMEGSGTRCVGKHPCKRAGCRIGTLRIVIKWTKQTLSTLQNSVFLYRHIFHSQFIDRVCPLLQKKKNRVPQVTLLPCPPSALNHANPLLSNQEPRLLAPPSCGPTGESRAEILPWSPSSRLRSAQFHLSLRSVIPTTASSPFLQNLYQHHQIIIQEMSSRGGKLAPEVNR